MTNKKQFCQKFTICGLGQKHYGSSLFIKECNICLYKQKSIIHFCKICFVIGQKGVKGEQGKCHNNTEKIEKIEETISEMQRNNSKLYG